MLTKLIVENYKSIERAELYFSKINLLIGPNGSGKSSVLEGVELLISNLRQGILIATIGGDASLTGSSPPLKNFYRVVRNHDANRSIVVKGKFDQCEVRLKATVDGTKLEVVTNNKFTPKEDFDVYFLKANRRLLELLKGVLSNPREITTTNAHQLFYYACYRTEFKENIQMIREFYSRYGLHDVRWVPTERPNEYEIIATTPEGVDVNLADAGAGLAALFPIVVALSFYPGGSTVFIEHPEMHLHPKLQYELAEFLLMVLEKRNYQLIIETHSEHLLYGLLNAVAQKRLEPEELTVYSTRKERGKSVFGKMIVHEDGSLEGNLSDFLEADIDAFLDWLKA